MLEQESGCARHVLFFGIALLFDLELLTLPVIAKTVHLQIEITVIYLLQSFKMITLNMQKIFF